MASCKFEGGKCKSKQQAKAYLRHNDKEKREQTEEHSNKDIDKSKTYLNQDLLNMSYEDKCKKYDDRINELDTTTNTNKRKDRVTMQSIVVPVPSDLSRNQYDAWFNRAYEILNEKYGDKNCVCVDIHYDEEHEYIDPETHLKTVSKVHMHYGTIPVLDGKLNGKWCSSRANMIQLNNALQEMSQLEFGVDFMDGTKRKGGKSTENLKNASKQAELDEREKAVSQQAEKNKQDAKQNLAMRTRLNADREAFEQEKKDFALEKENWRIEAYNELEEQKKVNADNFKREVEAAVERRIAAMQQEQQQEQPTSRKRRLPGEPEF